MSEGKVVEVALRSPFTMMVAGPTGSGKTRLLVDLISQASEITDLPPSDIIYCFSKWQTIYDVLEEKYNVKFYKGLPDEEIIPSDGKKQMVNH
jgi:septin family protein